MRDDLNTASGPYEIITGRDADGLILICDHASNHIPQAYDGLGLDPACLERHIAYDIGAARVTRELARLSGVSAVLSKFSRLVIDPNRGLDDPTLVMKLSDGAIIPGNRDADADEVARRLIRFYQPYDAAITGQIARTIASGHDPALVSIHSFTPVWKDVERVWHFGVLWDTDSRLAMPLIHRLREEEGMVVGDNQPYSGALTGDTMNRHGTVPGYPHALIEIRQDLIDDDQKADRMAGRLANVLNDVLKEL